jgi:DNA primase
MIRIRPGLDAAAAVGALAHELGHVLLHWPGTCPPGVSTAGCRRVAQVEAASVAFVVCAGLGLDTAGFTFPHVASWAGGDERARPAGAIHGATGHVMAAASVIGRQLSQEMPAGAARPAAAVKDQDDALFARTEPGPKPPAMAAAAPVPAAVARVLADAQRFYTARLAGSWVPGYLTGRGLRGAAERWDIGYAPGGWTALTGHLRGLGHHGAAIEAAGLARPSRRGILIDVFRDRAMLAVRGERGQIAGFWKRSISTCSGAACPHVPDAALLRVFRAAVPRTGSRPNLALLAAPDPAGRDPRRRHRPA